MLTKAYGADSAKSGLSFICRFKTGREFMKDERIGHTMTRRMDESMEQVWTFVCRQTIQYRNYDKGSKCG